jgi:UDP-N-acetylenolpyruvoylglucosamine reductase
MAADHILPGTGRGTSEAGGGGMPPPVSPAASRLHHQPATDDRHPRIGEDGNVRGRLTPNAPLAPLVWFKAGGAAEWLFEPADADDLAAFLRDLDPAVAVMALGLGSNLIVRDGGVPGVVIRLGKPFARVEALDTTTLRCGGGASGILVSSTARDAGIAGVEFLRSIPGTVGGFVRMNGGAYGREVKDVLVEAEVVLRSGERRTLSLDELGYTYRHSALPDGAVVIAATFRGEPGEPAAIQAEMDRIAAAALEDRRLDLQEPRRAQGVGIGRSGRLSRQAPGRRAGERQAHQLPAQRRAGHQRRYRGAGRGSPRCGQGDERGDA